MVPLVIVAVPTVAGVSPRDVSALRKFVFSATAVFPPASAGTEARGAGIELEDAALTEVVAVDAFAAIEEKAPNPPIRRPTVAMLTVALVILCMI
jgi:hypothetical protein